MRRKFYTRITDETGAPLSSAPTVYALRAGAVVYESIAITANGTHTVKLRHPGTLKSGDLLGVWASGTFDRSFSVTTAPTYNAGGYWEIGLTEQSGEAFTLSIDQRLVLTSVSAHRVTVYDDDTTTTSSSVLPSTTTGAIEFYADAVDVDLYVNADGEIRYYPDFSSEPRNFVTPEEFGAAGDGVTDDSVPVQAALDQVSEIHGGGVVWFGSGDGYSVTGVSATSADVLCAGYSVPASVQGGKPRALFGSGSPESAVTAPIGSVYGRTDGGAGTALYFKESGTGNTGWVPVADLSSPVMTGDLDIDTFDILFDGSVMITEYGGSPESNVTAPVGSLCLDSTNGAIYVKESGSGDTGWDAVDTDSLPLSGGTLTGTLDLDGNNLTMAGGTLSMGGGTLDMEAGFIEGTGYIDSDTTTSPTSYTAIATHTIAQDRMAANTAIRVEAFGEYTGTNGTKDARLVLGSSTLISLTQATAGEEFKWEMKATIVFSATNAQKTVVRTRLNNIADSENDYVETTEDNGAGSLNLKVEANLASGSDTVTLGGFVIEYLGGA